MSPRSPDSDKGEKADARRGYLPLLQELLRLYPAFADINPTVRDGYREVAHLAHGWYLRCHRGIEAVLMLGDAGYAEEAAPIRRSVIEHVLALKWLAAEGDKIIDTVARGHAHDAEKRGDAVAAAGWTSVELAQFEQVIAGIDPARLDAHNDQMLNFAQRLARYGDKHTTPGYLAEVARSHPSYESAICYIEVPSGKFLFASRNAVWPVPFLTTHLLEALLTLRSVFDPEPWEAELESIGQRYFAVTDEVRKQDGLAPVDWSTGEVKK